MPLKSARIICRCACWCQFRRKPDGEIELSRVFRTHGVARDSSAHNRQRLTAAFLVGLDVRDFAGKVRVHGEQGANRKASHGSGGILETADLRFLLRTVRFAFPRVRERRPCAAKRTVYGTTVIGKAFALLFSFDSTITFG